MPNIVEYLKQDENDLARIVGAIQGKLEVAAALGGGLTAHQCDRLAAEIQTASRQAIWGKDSQ